MSRTIGHDVAQAFLMLDAFISVGVRAFDVTLTDVDGEKLRRGYQSNRPVDELRRAIGTALQEADRRKVNYIIRPQRVPSVDLIQLDDLATSAAACVQPFAFMVLRTSPGNYQAWVAVKDSPPDFARRLRKGASADPTASGATRISGSRNFKTKYAPDFPRVEVTHVAAGKITTVAALEKSGLVAPPESPARVSPRASAGRSRRARKWPSYALCVQNAPPVHRGERPDISKADFTWCMTAIDWGWSIEDTAARLMEESTKARENGEGYALLTARNAAAAVERRGSSPKTPPAPR
jgi:hypothetical protein